LSKEVKPVSKVKAIHVRTGFVGQITDEAAYEGVKTGTLDWKPHVKAKMESIQIPVSLFYRLMELDKSAGSGDRLTEA
jgi:hypothetical protein